MKISRTEKAEQIVSAAISVFLRYEFRRVTMADLAEAADVSRPSLYLEFGSKEEIFVAVVERLSQQALDEIRATIPKLRSVDTKLEAAFEIWLVRPFELVQRSPDAADLFTSVKEFACEAISKTSRDFEELLAEILQPLMEKQKSTKFSADQIARLLRIAAKGSKAEAKSSEELREMIRDLRKLFLSAIR